jgi:outer membrane biosynthesis protein TonB
MSDAAEQRTPALIASAILHVGIVAATLIAWPHFGKPITMQASVPVTLVAHAPVADVRPAIEAPEAQIAQAEEPAPPTPQPPAPEVVEAPPAPPPPVPKAAAPAPPKPQPTLDLNALAKSAKPTQRQLDLKALSQQKPRPTLDLDSLAAGGRPRNAQRGPNRAETDTQARQALGAASGLTADEASLLYAKLIKLWNPNCAAEGGANIVVKVHIRLSPEGRLQIPPQLASSGSGAIWQAAATRALTAVARGEPYTELRRERYNAWKDIVFNFDARKACFG